MKDLTKLREEIDRADEELRESFTARMAAVEKIAAAKREAGLAIYDAGRERDVIRKSEETFSGDPEVLPYYRAFVKSNMALSRAYQESLAGDGSGADPAVVPVTLGERSYKIRIGRGALARIAEFFRLDRRVFILTDDGVPEEYAKEVANAAKDAFVYTIPHGEASKSLAIYEKVLTAMQNAGISRSDCLVAVGGGVVSDLGGFAAATYRRGIDFYTIPTTLLGAVDAAIGGKCAVDLGGVKNAVGAFWQPRGVLIDPEVFATLPEREFRAGYAEIIKMAVAFDEETFAALENEPITDALLDRTMLFAIKKKTAVVESDERESGERKLLNFGHTLGHAIEALAAGKLLHGEAVAVGMLPMCGEATKKRLTAVLQKFGLPTEYPASGKDLAPYLFSDKKGDGERIAAIRAYAPGDAKVEETTVEELVLLWDRNGKK